MAGDTKRTVFDIGDTVLCDSCDDDYTESDACGGLLFESKAICPTCAPRWEEGARKFNETHFIKDRALIGETFRAAVMRWRGGNNTITITSKTNADESIHDLAKASLHPTIIKRGVVIKDKE